MQPDIDVMGRFLAELFAGAPPGLIEIAYSGSDGKPDRAIHYPVTDHARAAADAARLNATEGTNVYYGAAVRRLDCPPKRTLKHHVLGTSLVWADFDRDVARSRAAWEAAGAIPTAIVTTGTVPEPRAQAVWRLKQWFTEPAVIERNLRAAALAFGGDPAVVDCSRVMRLPGSVSYPKAKKPGRVAELVTVEYPEL